MKLFKFSVEDVDYGQFDGVLIIAEDRLAAREILLDKLEESSVSQSIDAFHCEEIVLATAEAGVLLASYCD